MTEEVRKLIDNFKIIANKKWIKSISKSFGSIGITFEKELDKTPDALYFPDYYGTEIKCVSRYSRYPLFLFTVAFDGPTFPEINRIVEKYGYPDKTFPDKKVLFEKVSCNKKNLVNDKYKFKLEVDDKEGKLYLCVYNLDDELIERESFVYLKTIEEHLTLKLNRLAIVSTSTKKELDEKYFRYYKIDIYNLIGFDRFLRLLRFGVIEVSLISRISKSGEDTGRYRNKNLVFSIKKNNIEKLFTNIYSYDNDLAEVINYNKY